MQTTHFYEYEYDPAARLKTVKTDGVVTLDLTYDLNGNPELVIDRGNPEASRAMRATKARISRNLPMGKRTLKQLTKRRTHRSR